MLGPECPRCAIPLGTPTVYDGDALPDYWEGPPDANLYCPGCRVGWVGTPEEVAQATKSFEDSIQMLEPLLDALADLPEGALDGDES